MSSQPWEGASYGSPVAGHELKKGGRKMKTNLGYTVHTIHPMAANGYKYRIVEVSGTRHVEEYVAPCGVWVYMGWIVR